jgi:hypothetical protein
MSASIVTYGTLVQWIVSERRAGVSDQLTLMRAKEYLYPHQDPRPGEGPNLPTTIPTQSDTSIKT